MALIENSILADMLYILWDGISACYSWLLNITTYVGLPLIVFLVCVVGVWSLYKYVLSPMLSGSDLAKFNQYRKR